MILQDGAQGLEGRNHAHSNLKRPKGAGADLNPKGSPDCTSHTNEACSIVSLANFSPA